MGYDERIGRHHPQASAYHGLASLCMSGIFLLMALPALELANTLQRSGYEGFDRMERRIAAIGGYVGGGAIVLLCIIAAGIAVGGVKVSGRTGESAILCVAGLLLALFAALLWIACVGSWHAQACACSQTESGRGRSTRARQGRDSSQPGGPDRRVLTDTGSADLALLLGETVASASLARSGTALCITRRKSFIRHRV